MIQFIAVKLMDQDHKEGRKFTFQSLETDQEAKASVEAVSALPPGTHWEITFRLMDDNGNPIKGDDDAL